MFCLLFFLPTLGFTSSLPPESVSDADIQLLVNTLRYIRGLDKADGRFQIGVVYQVDNASSRAEAEAFLDAFSRAPTPKNRKITARLLPVDELDGGGDCQIFYLAQGLDDRFAEIYEFSTKNHIFTVSRDKRSAEATCSVLAFNTQSGVEIFLNAKTMRSLGFAADAAFKFMVKRL